MSAQKLKQLAPVMHGPDPLLVPRTVYAYISPRGILESLEMYYSQVFHPKRSSIIFD